MRAIFIFTILFSSVLAVQGQGVRALQIFEKGIEASRAGDQSTAVTHFAQTLNIIERDGASDRFFATVHYNLGISNYHLRRHHTAAEQVAKAIGFDRRGYEKAYYALGLIRSELGEWAPAEKAFRKAIALNNRNGEAWFDLAFVYLARGDRPNAQKAFEKAIKHGTIEQAISQNNLGVLLAIDGRYDEALPHFEAAEQSAKLKTAIANREKCRQLASGKSGLLAATAFTFARRNTTNL